MYHTSLIQLIFLIAAVLLFISGLYLIFINKKFRVPGIILAVSSILYFGLTFLLYNSQSKIDNVSSQSSNAQNVLNTYASNSTPIVSSSKKPSKFLTIPVTEVKNTDIQPLAAAIESDIETESNTDISNAKITASVDNTKPTMGQTVYITVTGPVGASIYATAKYKNASVSSSGVIGSDGTTKISFAMGNAAPGETVNVDMTAILNGNTYYAQVSFTEAN